MKKVVFIALIAVVLFSSCSMDVEPENNNNPNSRNVEKKPDDLPRIILIGDSRTAQWSTTNQDNIPIAPLSTPLPHDVVPGFFDGYDVDNIGVGETTTSFWVDPIVLGNLKTLEPTNVGEKKTYDIAIISIGGNDCLLNKDVNQSIMNIALLTTQVKKIADRVYLATIPDFSLKGYLDYSYQDYHNEMYKKYLEEYSRWFTFNKLPLSFWNPVSEVTYYYNSYKERNKQYNIGYQNIGIINNRIRSYWRNYADGMIDVAKEMNSFQTKTFIKQDYPFSTSPFSGVFLTSEYSLDGFKKEDYGIHFSYMGYQKLEEIYLKAIPSPDQFINSME